MISHVSEKLVERCESLIAHIAIGWMIIAVCSQMRRQIVLLIEAFVTKRAFKRFLACVGALQYLEFSHSCKPTGMLCKLTIWVLRLLD